MLSDRAGKLRAGLPVEFGPFIRVEILAFKIRNKVLTAQPPIALLPERG